MSPSIITNNLYSYMDESSIHPLLKCNLCRKPFVDPVSTQTGDRFCRACIVGVLSRRSIIGSISTKDNHSDQQIPIPNLTPVTERLVLEMLNNLLVRCTKCGQTDIKRGELEEHVNKFCTQATVLCDAHHLKCSWMGARDELDEHMDECKFEPLRPALEFIFIENAELKKRLDDLEAEINQLLTIKNMNNINFDS